MYVLLSVVCLSWSVCVCVRVCVHVCACVRVCVCVWMYMSRRVYARLAVGVIEKEGEHTEIHHLPSSYPNEASSIYKFPTLLWYYALEYKNYVISQYLHKVNLKGGHTHTHTHTCTCTQAHTYKHTFQDKHIILSTCCLDGWVIHTHMRWCHQLTPSAHYPVYSKRDQSTSHPMTSPMGLCDRVMAATIGQEFSVHYSVYLCVCM